MYVLMKHTALFLNSNHVDSINLLFKLGVVLAKGNEVEHFPDVSSERHYAKSVFKNVVLAILINNFAVLDVVVKDNFH